MSDEHAGEFAEPPLRYFLDTEFIEDGTTIDLVSIGVVCEDGREFYAENLDADLSRASDWVKENVLPHLWHRQASKRDANQWSLNGGAGGLLHRSQIARDLRRWVSEGERPTEFWAYYADYDWVVLCWLFGTMLDLPDGWPMLCLDIKQEAIRLGNPPLPEQSSTEHHALADARWNAEAHAFLARLSGSRDGGSDV